MLHTFVLERKNTFFSLFGKTSVWDPLVKFFEREGSKSDSVIAGGRVAVIKIVQIPCRKKGFIACFNVLV